MKNQPNKKTLMQPYKLNSFVDLQSSIDGKFNECEIIDIQQSRIVVKGIRDDFKNFVDINSQKLRPFRTASRPFECPITYHKNYSYWGDGFYWSFQYLKKIKEYLYKLKPHAREVRGQQMDDQCRQIINPAQNNNQQQISLDPAQIIQYLRGKIYYSLLSINDDKNITQASRQKILQFVLLFLDFFIEYLSIFNWSETDIKNIYQSPRNALMSSFPQIMINLLLIFNRRSYLEPITDVRQRQKFDKIMNSGIEWLHNSLIPHICQGSFQKINFQIAIKLTQLFIKLTGTDRLPRTEKTEECIKILLTCACNQTKKITTLSKFLPNYQYMEDILINCAKTQKQFLYSKICKLCLLRRFQNIMSQNPLVITQKSALLLKHMNFVIACMEEPELKNQVLKYLYHENGLAYYLKTTPPYSPTLNETLSKLSRFCPQLLIKESIRLKKIQYIRHNSFQWSIKLLISIMKSFIEQKKPNEKQELYQSKEMHKIITNELKNLLQKQDPNSTIEEKKLIGSLISNLQIRMIHIYEALFDGQRTVTVEYFQKSVVPKYVENQFEKIILTLEEKETNLFRQLFILKQLHKKINLSKQNQVSKNLYIIVFAKLCKSMPLYKAKTILQPRRQLLFVMLSKIINIFPEQFTTLFCCYIESVKKVMNKQFKTKALEQYPTLINTKANLFKNEEQKIKKFKRIIDSMKIQTLSQFKTFMYFFKAVGNYENTIKIDETFIPLVIYKRPYGIQKIYEVYRLKNCEKILLKKIEYFLFKINLKFVDMDQKSKFVQELTENLIDIMGNLTKNTLEWNKNDLISQIQQILYSLTKSHHDWKLKDMVNFDFDYSKLFIDKNTKLNKQMSSNNYRASGVLVLNEQNVDAQVAGEKEKENKNSKIKVTVLFERDEVPRNQQEYSSEAGDQISHEMEEEVKNKNGKFQLYVERDQRLYSIKSKAATSFQISPIASNFIMGNQQIPHCDQALTVQSLLQMASLNDEQQNQQLTISLKQHPRSDITKKILLKNLDILYLCLPQTDRLWRDLEVRIDVWTQQHKLRQLKQNFIRYQPQEDSSDEMANEDDRNQLSYWAFIMDSPIRRNIMMEALIADNELNLSRVKWLFYSFSQMKNKNDLTNNILSYRLIQKSQKTLTEQEAEKVLQKLKINQKQLSPNSLQEFKQNFHTYENLLRSMFTYIEQHIYFNLFTFIMSMDHQFFDNLAQCEKYNLQFGYLFLKSFVRYTSGEQLTAFLQFELESYVMQFQKSFHYLIVNLERSNIHYHNEGFSQVLSMLLQRSIDLIMNDERFNSEFNSHFYSTYLLLSLISILLYKEIKSENIINPNFINILNGYLYSKLCNQTISIISCIVGQYPAQGEKFIEQFRKEMDEPDWERKQIIKFNKSSLRHESDYVGLKNPHSICYVNSLLQQLFHIKMFREQIYLTNWKKNSSIEEDLIFQLKRIFINLHLLHCDAYFNKHFFEAFKNDEGSATSLEVQMDVDEFRSILFDRIENLIIKPQNQTRNFVQNIFNGKQLTIIKSKQCQHESTRQEQFSSICLQVKGLKKLQDSLAHYFHPQTLDGDNMYFCDVCGKKVVAQKTNQIKQYPRYLTFVLKRFEYVYQYRKKINERFEFPLEVLSLGGNRYFLKGIIVHQGLSEAGHYFSLIKLKGKWFEFNDNTISQVTQKDVANLGYGDSTTKCNRNAYLLFYQRQGDSDIAIKQMTSNRNILPLQFGLDDQVADIIKCNRLLWKADLFLSEQYQNFMQTAVREKIKGSVLLLYQYITTIKVKRPRFEIKNLKTLFQLLQNNMTENFLDSEQHVSWALQFYRNSQFNSSLKAALTKILVKNYKGFDEYLKKFLKMCIIFIHEQAQTSHYYHLFLEFSKKSPEILKYLVDTRIIGRIFDISYTQLLLTIDRQSLSESTQISFPLMEYFKNSRKKAAEHNELRYHKWKLINYILRSNIELHKIQNNYIHQWNERKSQLIFEQGQSKVTINEISKFFCYLSEKNQTFGDLYLKQVCEQISKDKSQNLRRYLKAASDLMKINDSQKMYRMTKIKQAFAETLKMLHKQKIMSSFDLKWQWFIRIGFINPEFRRIIRSSAEQFKIINTKTQLQNLYLTRNEINSEGKYKNKYFGLKFSSIGSTSNSNFLEEKFQRNKILFFGNQNEQIFSDLSIQSAHFDTDLTDFPHIQIKEDMTILRFSEQTSKFKQVTVTQCLGECIEIENQRYDKGDERLMHCFEKTIAIKKQQQAKEQRQQEICSN